MPAIGDGHSAPASSRGSTRPRVVVTGLGTVTPMGEDVRSTWHAIMAGASGISKLTEPWAGQLGVRIAGRVTVDLTESLGRVAARKLDRSQQLALVSAREAWESAGAPDVEPERLAVVVGSGVGGVRTLLDQHDITRESGPGKVSPHTIPRLMLNSSAGAVSIEFGAKGGAHAPASACATGAEAIWWAQLLIQSGRADVVIAGGTEACIRPVSIAAFDQMRALSRLNDDPERASRPFDRDRTGFVMAEGAAILVLEREEHARARGARARAILAGSGVTSDAVSPTKPDLEGQVRAIRQALGDAGMGPLDVQHVNAHATGTPTGDVIEAQAIEKAIGLHPAVTAIKSYSGHLLGAAGAFEAVVAILSVEHGIAPVVRNLEQLDPEVRLDVVQGSHRREPGLGVAMSSSFGFGGHNVILVFTRP